MADFSELNDEENWNGGYYELSIEMGPTDDGRLERALLALWRETATDGCFVAASYHPAEHAPAPLTLASLEAHGHLRGVVRLPNGRQVVCGVVAVRFENDSDWMHFYLPLGALARTDPAVGGYPFSDEPSLNWRGPIDDWLAAVASRIYAEVPYRSGVIGMEVGVTDAPDPTGGISEHRQNGLLVPTRGSVAYYPANE